MKIALLGTRGIPASYGGFETFAEEISARLAERGHEVTVYCRSHYARRRVRSWRGARLAVLPTIRTKHLDTAVHTILSCLHLALRRSDAAIVCNGANAVFCCWPRALGIPALLNVDGLERKRSKWNRAAKAWYHLSERLSTFCPNAVVTDARVIQRYYGRRYGLATHYIPYGAPKSPTRTTRKVEDLGLEPGEYFLYVSRFEPENNALLVVREYERSRTDRKLVMVGDAPYAASYIKTVKATRDPRIVFAGPVYGKGYAELQSHCLAYVHATEVGGTHPALVEAMGRRCALLYLDTPENREVVGPSGLVYTRRPHSLRQRIDELSDLGERALDELRRASAREAAERYDWEAVADSYESVLAGLVGSRALAADQRQLQ